MVVHHFKVLESGQQEKGKPISLTPPYNFHLFPKHLDNSQKIIAEFSSAQS